MCTVHWVCFAIPAATNLWLPSSCIAPVLWCPGGLCPQTMGWLTAPFNNKVIYLFVQESISVLTTNCQTSLSINKLPTFCVQESVSVLRTMEWPTALFSCPSLQCSTTSAMLGYVTWPPPPVGLWQWWGPPLWILTPSPVTFNLYR